MPDRIATCLPRLELRPLSPADAAAYYELVQRNRSHLTQFGDYEELTSSSPDEIQRSLTSQPESGLNMGVWHDDELIGVTALNPVKPGIYVLGYWMDAAHTGRGYTTASCRALMDYALENLDVAAFWAGIRHANLPSIRVAEKLGFKVHERLTERSRWWIDCSAES